MAQTFAHIGEHRLSHVWYRIISRPEFRYRMRERNLINQNEPVLVPGRVEDKFLLDQITRYSIGGTLWRPLNMF